MAVPLPAALVPAIIHIDIDPVLHVGGLAIHWYGVMYAIAFWVGLRYGVVPFLGRYGISRQQSESMCFWVIIVGLLGARLYYVVQNSPPQGGSWLSHPGEILAVWHGGMAFFGAVFVGLPFAMFLAWRRGLNGWLIGDAAALFAVLGQPIGRIGNVINGDILGHASTLPWATAYFNPNAFLQPGFCLSGQAFPSQSGAVTCAANTVYGYQPAAVYEALGTILIGLVLWRLLVRGVVVGTLILVYLELYAVSQFLIFFLRGTEPEVGLGLKQAQWTALVVGLLVVPALVWVRGRGLLMWGGEPVLVSTVGAPGSEETQQAAAEPSGGAAAAVAEGAEAEAEAAPPDPAAFERGDAGAGPEPEPEREAELKAEPEPTPMAAQASPSGAAATTKRRSTSKSRTRR